MLLAAALLAFARAGGAQEATATGVLTLNGVSTPLSHVYISTQPGFFDKSIDDIRIVLSDQPLDDATRASMSGLVRLGRSGAAHIVEVIVDARGEPMTGAIYATGFGGMASLSGMHQFAPTRWEYGRAEGTLQTDAPRTFAGVTYQYHATFAATIPRPPTAAELADRLNGPESMAAGAYLRALRGGALPAFVATLTASAATDYAGPTGAGRFAQLRADMPIDARVTDVPTRSPTSATVTVQGHQQRVLIEYMLTLERESGVWKVAR